MGKNNNSFSTIHITSEPGFEVKNLTSSTTYYFRIALAANSSYYGPFSNHSQYTTSGKLLFFYLAFYKNINI